MTETRKPSESITISITTNRPTGAHRYVDFYHPTDAQLENLAKACQPATFGMNQQDVYDETYRKAGKMDVGRFSTQFQPANHGIIGVIRDVLLGNGADLASIRVELYKLNVYGRLE